MQLSSSSANQNAALILDHQLDFTSIQYAHTRKAVLKMFRKLRLLGCRTKKLTLSVALIIIFVIWLDSLSIYIFSTSEVGYKLNNYTADKNLFESQRIGKFKPFC